MSIKSMNEAFAQRVNSGADVERTAFFSDAVFAIAMTLLAVDIKVPRVAGDELGRAVVEQGPEFAAYLLSFVVTAAYWLSHHRLFRLLSGYTVVLQRLNLGLLLMVGLIGYAADMMAFYSDQVLGVVIYATILGLIGVANTTLWVYAGRRGLFQDDIDPQLLAYAQRRVAVTPAVFLLSIPIAFISPTAAALSWAAIVVGNLIFRFLGRRAAAADVKP
ncbi:TMEM175 family protein [Arthrobacter sp. ZGTC212]|uniref:TMEM175 family protein n=1 Tax=Arthrobacter sp. ZGTC212 TaxID=2058899 RepID=UPI000CE4CD86|nr:TMEM175 family protein [Arthrobacter sp. ZGTC212]